MRISKWWIIAIGILHLATCFFPWVIIESRNIIISGVEAAGTAYGKPGYFNFFLAGIVMLLSFFPRIWALRINLFLAAFNIGWSLRNFIILSICRGGECPQRQTAFYLYLISSVLLLLAVIFQDINIKEEKEPAGE